MNPTALDSLARFKILILKKKNNIYIMIKSHCILQNISAGEYADISTEISFYVYIHTHTHMHKHKNHIYIYILIK